MARTHLKDLFEVVEEALKKELDGQRVHMGFDLWTSATPIPFLIATLHWIDEKWQLKRAGFVLFFFFFMCF